jgi:CrcB protein
LLVCLAGAAGTGVRYLIALWTAQRFGNTFPYGTVAVNLAGCFFIAAVIQTAAAWSWSETARAVVTVGFLGGFTTYSTFNQDTLRLFASGTAGAAALNLFATLFGGLAAGLLGLAAGRALTGQ